MPRCLVGCLAVLLLLLSDASPAVAQAPPGPEATTWLPPADVFGADWIGLDSVAVDRTTAVIREDAMAVYVGPAGARIVIAAFLVADDTVMRRAWDEVIGLAQLTAFTLSSNLILDPEDTPATCVEGQRASGAVLAFASVETAIPGAVTVCAVDPDVLLLLETSGTIMGLEGPAAADAVLSTILTAGGAATPAP